MAVVTWTVMTILQYLQYLVVTHKRCQHKFGKNWPSVCFVCLWLNFLHVDIFYGWPWHNSMHEMMVKWNPAQQHDANALSRNMTYTDVNYNLIMQDVQLHRRLFSTVTYFSKDKATAGDSSSAVLVKDDVKCQLLLPDCCTVKNTKRRLVHVIYCETLSKLFHN